MLSNTEETQDGWARFTADLSYSMFESSRAEQIIVIFSEAEDSARTFAYVVDDSGPTIPKDSDQLQRSKTDRFLPVELAVPYQLRLLIATVKGTEPPPLPDFEPPNRHRRDRDYIEASGLDYTGEPDWFVFKATTAAAVGLGAWLLLRRSRYSWRTSLTSSPELVRQRNLPKAVKAASRDLPDPVVEDESGWRLHDRGRRVQEAISEILSAHPDWASDSDFSHRHAIAALVETDRWVRSALRQKPNTQHSDEPRFCFFFPTHTSAINSFAWKQSKTALTIDVCTDCRADLNAGHEPECLMVPKRPGAKWVRPIPYYLRDDAYAASGFGSFAALEDSVIAASTQKDRARR